MSRSSLPVGFLSLAVMALGVVAAVLVLREPGRANRNRSTVLGRSAAPVAKPGYTLVKEYIGERRISAYLLSKDDAAETKRPAVALIHGGSVLDPLSSSTPQSKDEWFNSFFEDVPYRLAGRGMLVIAMDAWWAGERYSPAHADLVEASPAAALIRGYVETAQDVSHVIDYLCTRDDVDPARIGVAGKSGGGIISLMAACTEQRLAAVVAWKAGADFVELARLRGQGILFNQAIKRVAGFREELQRVDPIYHYQNIPPKALALIGNREDPLMPRQGAEKLYRKLRPLYDEHPERLKLDLFDTPVPTHDDQPEALVAGCQWLERFLVQGG